MHLLLALVLASSEPANPLPDRPSSALSAGPSATPEMPSPAAATHEGVSSPSGSGRSSAQVTLLGAGALGPGGAAWLTEVGYPYLAVSYSQGLTAADDLGGTANFAWPTSEMLLAVTWREQLAGSTGSRLGWQLVGGPWLDFGSTWIYAANRTNWGPEASPGIAWTPEVGPGLLTVAIEMALTWAMDRGMGLAAEPLVSVAYEAPVARDLAVGGRAYLAVRWSSGSAQIPGFDGHATFGLTMGVTWRMF